MGPITIPTAAGAVDATSIPMEQPGNGRLSSKIGGDRTPQML